MFAIVAKEEDAVWSANPDLKSISMLPGELNLIPVWCVIPFCPSSVVVTGLGTYHADPSFTWVPPVVTAEPAATASSIALEVSSS